MGGALYEGGLLAAINALPEATEFTWLATKATVTATDPGVAYLKKIDLYGALNLIDPALPMTIIATRSYVGSTYVKSANLRANINALGGTEPFTHLAFRSEISAPVSLTSYLQTANLRTAMNDLGGATNFTHLAL